MPVGACRHHFAGAEHERFIIEGAAAVPIAAVIKEAQRYQGRKVALVLCGRNIAVEKFLSVLSG